MGCVAFCMLNPSTADEKEDDRTITRCIDFARRWGFQGLLVVNLFAFRATKPAILKRATDPVGKENDAYLRKAAKEADLFVCAWGTNGKHQERDRAVLSMLREKGVDLHCLVTTVTGFPGHPLYLRGDTRPARYRGQ